MSRKTLKGVAVVSLATVAGLGGGYWLAQHNQPAVAQTSAMAANVQQERKVLYWYDPMSPQQKFDKPGKSPFMDMDLVPRYADESGATAAVSIDPGVSQNLGVRVARVELGKLDLYVEASGVLAFNARDVAQLQARAGGFVERVYRRAPGDVLEKGAPLADMLVPEWIALQEEFLALRRMGDAQLIGAARQRMRVAGMPNGLIEQIERSGQSLPMLTIVSPIHGSLEELNVRAGMSLLAGADLAKINGLQSVWLEVAIPEALGSAIRPGQEVETRLPALPGEIIHGTVTQVLSAADAASRTLRVRVELPNPQGQLRPGLTAYVKLASGSNEPVLHVPSEAVIRTGKRSLVMLAEPEGRYRPVEVRLGQEGNGRIAILHGLEEGQQVVASGQFLLDSEASLRGIVATEPDMAGHQHATAPATGPVLPGHEPSHPSAHASHSMSHNGHGTDPAHAAHTQPNAVTSSLHEAEGHIQHLGSDSVRIAHGPFRTLGMPGMTMTFRAATPTLLQPLKVGDAIHFAVRETDNGLLIERIQRKEQQP